jgi:hypothetical protein
MKVYKYQKKNFEYREHVAEYINGKYTRYWLFPKNKIVERDEGRWCNTTENEINNAPKRYTKTLTEDELFAMLF